VLSEIDAIGITANLGLRSLNPSRALAERIGAQPAIEFTTAVGGEMPLTLVDHVARQIESGVIRSALVAGTHALRTLRNARRDGVELDWYRDEAPAAPLFGEQLPGSNDLEAIYGLDRPSSVYPLFENALRARRGLGLEAQRLRTGALMSRFTAVAARNPYAWFPVERSADEITLPVAGNRMVAFPYTKYMNAVLETDQAACVWLMSAAAARAARIPEERWVYYHGGASAVEKAWFATERPDFAACPALREAAEGALGIAGVALDDIAHLDLYSCFPVAVEMACEMLGLGEDDPRGLTLTGGLPYAGGPGNNYTLHSLATLADRLRADPGSLGMVTGNGWYLTKHSACIFSTTPREKEGAPASAPDAPEPLPVVTTAQGRGRVEAYTVLFDREGAPQRGIVVGRLESGERFVANTPDDRGVLESLVHAEGVGREGLVAPGDGPSRFDPR
jgi:acetyl-CoA C-acetyltransferase